MNDLISRQALKYAMYHAAFECDTEMQRWDSGCWLRYRLVEKIIDSMPSAEPEVKPISYTDCVYAMMAMWIDNVVTAGEYNRIMDKLNAHEKRRAEDAKSKE